LRDDLFVIDQGREVRLCGDDPFPGISCATGVFCNRDYFEFFVLEFLIECLPAWQIKSATSPRGPCD
jgi:hypothetical protein